MSCIFEINKFCVWSNIFYHGVKKKMVIQEVLSNFYQQIIIIKDHKWVDGWSKL